MSPKHDVFILSSLTKRGKILLINCPSFEKDIGSNQSRSVQLLDYHVGLNKNILDLVRHFYSIMRKKYDIREKKLESTFDCYCRYSELTGIAFYFL